MRILFKSLFWTCEGKNLLQRPQFQLQTGCSTLQTSVSTGSVTLHPPSESVMNRHIVDAHTIDSNFTYPSSNVKTICGYDIGPQDQFPDCDECDEEFSLDHAFAMHLFHSHKVGFDGVHRHQYLPGGDEMYSVHLQLCKAPCDGHPRCPCKYS